MANDDWEYGQNRSSRSGSGRDLDGEAIKNLLSRGFSMDAIVELMRSGQLRSWASASKGITGGGPGATRTQVGGKLLDFASSVIPGLRQRLSGSEPARRDQPRGGMSNQGRLDALRRARNAADRVNDIARKARTASKSNRQADTLGFGSFGGGGFEGGGYEPSIYTPPVISPRDFTDQANALAARAYGPMYAALEKGKLNASGQYNTSDAVVKGLYAKLGAEIASYADKQKQEYAQAGTDAGSRYADLQKQIGANYQAAAQQESDLMAQNGSQAAAADVIPDDRAFAQNQAATTGAATQDYFAQQGQAQQDHMKNLGVANSTEGNVQRQSLVRDLANVLNQYDQQNLSLQGQQAQTAMDIGNKLTDRDLAVQQANAGYGMDAWQANESAAANAAQIGQQGAQIQYDRGRDRVRDQQWEREQGLNEQKYRLDAASAVADAQAKSGGMGLDFNQLPPAQQVVAQADQLAGGRGQQYYDFVNKFMSQQNPDAYNLQTFSNAVAQAAAQNGLNPAIAMAIAGSYWNRIMNRS